MSAYDAFIAEAVEARSVLVPAGPRAEEIGVHRFLERCAEGGQVDVIGPDGELSDLPADQVRIDLLDALEAAHRRDPPEPREVSDAERRGVASAEPGLQYAHFVSQVADAGEVWVLTRGDEWAARRGAGDARLFPVWLHEFLAQEAAEGVWDDYRPTAVEIHQFLAILERIGDDEVTVHVTDPGDHIAVPNAELAEDILGALDAVQ